MKQQITIFFVVALAIFALGYAAFSILFRTDNPPEANVVMQYAVSPSRLDAAKGLVVKSVTGTAERSDLHSQKWFPVEPGNELFVDQMIRTQSNASVRLAVDEKSKIELSGGGELSIDAISDTVHKLHLSEGQVTVDYAPSEQRMLEITAANSKALAATDSGRFVMQNADGQVSVATSKGKVELTAEDKTVVVGPNTISHVLPGRAPETPTQIPLKVMLRVANPEKLRQQDKVTTIKGKTNVGAIVRVNDIPAAVGVDGRFEVAVPVETGKDRLMVTAKTAWGSAKEEVQLITATHKIKEAQKINSAKVRWGKPHKKKRKLQP